LLGLGLTPRPQQTKLAELIAQGGGAPSDPVVCQAGTGVGKSYVLLTAAVARHRTTGLPSVVVCPTNALVDQYVNKDAPRIVPAMGESFAYLKGRSNYLCSSSKVLSELPNPSDAFKDLLATMAGPDLSNSALMTPADYGCPGGGLCTGQDCGAFLARSEAAGHAVVVTNAHVVVWDERVRRWRKQATGLDEGLLPDYGGLFIDECHEFDPALRSTLTDQITDSSRVYQLMPRLRSWVGKQVARLAPGEEIAFPVDDPVYQSIRSRAQDEAAAIESELDQMFASPDEGGELPGPARDKRAFKLRRELSVYRRVASLADTTGDYGETYVVVLARDYSSKLPMVARSCVDASALASVILRKRATVLVSGTVPQTLPKQLGVASEIHDVGHPFDYTKSVLVIGSTDPRTKSALELHRRIELAAKAIRQSGGGTLLLFTSWSDLDTVASKLEGRIGAIPIYRQSRDNPADTADQIQHFRDHGDAVLAGVRTFFTGLDIPGPALRQVIVWRLPYLVPTLEIQALQQAHGPQIYTDLMLVQLVQGIGRLVRQPDDSGRVIVMDRRANGYRRQWPASALTAHLAEFRPTGGAPSRSQG